MSAAFVSYAREDQALVKRLHEALAGLGRTAWVDWEGIAPTAEWMAEIKRAIDGAQAAIFVLSPDWLSSQICALELEHAVLQGKRLVPLLHREAGEGQVVPEALAKLNWVMVREGDDFEQAVAKLAAALDTDLDWVREHTRLVVGAQRWDDRGRDDASLLRGRELAEAERWLAAGTADKDPAPVPLQAAFITSSREAARRRQRITRAVLAVGFVLTAGLAAWAWVERGAAVANEKQAQVNAVAADKAASEARVQEGKAKDSAKAAEQSASEARAARDDAVEQRKTAQAAQKEAERQRDAALARQLAARAQAQAAADPALLQKAALLAMESLRVLPNVEADQVLRRAIAGLPVRHAELAHAGVSEPGAVDSAGAFVAFAEDGGLLHVVDAGRMREVARVQTKLRVRNVHVDRGGRWVLFSEGERGSTALLTVADGSVRNIEGCSALGAAFGGRSASLLALGCHREVRLMDLADAAQPVRTLDSDGAQLALAFSGDSERLAGVDDSGDIRVWNVASGERLALVKGQTSESTKWSKCCTAFIGYSAGGGYIAASNQEGNELHVVSTVTWATHARLPHRSRVNVFAFDERRELLASGERSGRITVWDLDKQAILAQMSHADEIVQLRLYASPWDNSGQATLLSASTDRTARVWDPFTGAEIARAAQATPVIWVDRPWEPNYGRRFASLDSRTGLVQWGMQPPPAPLDLSRRNVTRAATLHCSDASGKKLWFADGGGVVGWDAEKNNTRYSIPGAPYGARPVVIEPACGWMAFATAAGLRIVAPEGKWDQPLWQENGADAAGGGDWQLSPRGTLLMQRSNGSYGSPASRAWRTTPWAPLAWGEGCKASDLLLSPDERHIAVNCGEGQLRVLDVASGRESARVAVKGALALTNAGHILWRAGRELSVSQGVNRGAQMLGRIELPDALRYAELATSPDGRVLAAVGDKRIQLWRLPSFTPLAHVDRSTASERKVFGGAAQFSPDSRQLLVSGQDRFYLFDAEGLALRTEIIQPGEVSLLQWDLPARRLVAQLSVRPLERDTQYMAVAWSLDTGAELQRVPLIRKADALRLTPDQRYLLADQVYRWSTESLAATACSLLARNLTRREWQLEMGGVAYRKTCAGLAEPGAGVPSWDQ